MTCAYTQDAAAYVLGALSPAERLEFERHAGGCDACAKTLGELAGLPGLLARVDASVLERSPVDEPLPPTLLDALTRQVGRARRRRMVLGVGVAAALLVVGGALGLLIGGDDASAPSDAGPSATQPALVTREMTPVGDGAVPVRASVTLEDVAWGTRLGLTCSYDPEWVEYELQPQARYALFVRTRDGHVERVGSWLSQEDRTVQLTAATAALLADIVAVEMRTADGRVVLRADA